MFTDIVGYTARTQSNEALMMEVLDRHNRLLRPFFPKFHGREVKAIGDSFLVEFESALDAVKCAKDIQSHLHVYNASSEEEWKIKLRIGIHLGDVMHKANDVFGDAVNIASRLEPIARPEGICISQQVYDQVRNKFDLPLVSLGEKSLKNVSNPVGVYAVQMPWDESIPGAQAPSLPVERVAVLPFVNISPDPNDEYFADGLTEELIGRLSLLNGLEVIARTSSMAYKKREKTAAQIGSELRVGTLLEGSVRKAGSRIRVTAQLINANTEGHLWSENYDRKLEDIFAVQSEIAEKLAGELKGQLLQAEKKTLEKKPTENMEAYNNFLRGREMFRELSEPAQKQALKLFERAVEIDPSFARAHVGVAECHQNLGNSGAEPPDVMFPAVKASLKRALELDPDLAEAHASLAMLHNNEDDLLGAEAEAERALELNPSLPEAYEQLFETAIVEGEPEKMVKNIETAYRLDPIRPEYIFQLGMVYLSVGREQDALEHWRRTEHLDPAGTYRNMAYYYLSKGDTDKAREFHAKFEKLQPASPWVIYMGGFIDAMAGGKAMALQAIEKIEGMNIGPIVCNWTAYIYYALGNTDKYFEYLNRAADEHALVGFMPMYSPLLAKAKNDPRYKELVEKVRKMNGLEK